MENDTYTSLTEVTRELLDPVIVINNAWPYIRIALGLEKKGVIPNKEKVEAALANATGELKRKFSSPAEFRTALSACSSLQDRERIQSLYKFAFMWEQNERSEESVRTLREGAACEAFIIVAKGSSCNGQRRYDPEELARVKNRKRQRREAKEKTVNGEK